MSHCRLYRIRPLYRYIIFSRPLSIFIRPLFIPFKSGSLLQELIISRSFVLLRKILFFARSFAPSLASRPLTRCHSSLFIILGSQCSTSLTETTIIQLKISSRRLCFYPLFSPLHLAPFFP